MSSEFSVADDAKKLISDIILKNNWEPIEVKYHNSTQAGDGFCSKYVSVDVVTENETFPIFIKCLHELPNMDPEAKKFCRIEPFFYNTVYPTYLKFTEERGVRNGFPNVAKCYGTSAKYAIALEDLKARGFDLCDRKKPLNDKHISLAFKAFARYHAISFAFKDQEREKYDKLAANTIQDMMMAQSKGRYSPPMDMLRGLIKESLSKFDPDADKHILEKFDVEDVLTPLAEAKSYLNEYSILIQGDSWCNNMMFLYEQANKDNPLDVVLIDWSLICPGSTVFDLSYFFYSVAGQEELNKFDFFLKEYHTELSQHIRALGSDPSQLYPFSVFEKEWKTHSKYGFSMAFMLVKFMLATTEEVPKLIEHELEDLSTTNFFPTFNKEIDYTKRMRDLSAFMVKRNFL